MPLENEVQVYENVKVSCFTGETKSYEEIFFTEVIRRRELDFIKRGLYDEKPRLGKILCFVFIAFPIARLLKVMKMKPSPWMIKAILLFENVMEKMPLIRCLNSNIVVLVRA